MTNDYVNKITLNDGTEFDIHDKRLEVTISDAGKVVAVDSSGNLSLVNAPSGGTKLYKHMLNNHLDDIVIVSKSSTPIVPSDGLRLNYYTNEEIVSMFAYRDDVDNFSSIAGVSFVLHNEELRCYVDAAFQNFELQNSFNNVTDTVIEL